MRRVLIFTIAFAFMQSCQTGQNRQPNQVTNPKIENDKIEFEFIHTKQNCKVVLDSEKNTFHKKTFCANLNNSDLKSTTEMSGMVNKALDLLNTALVDPKNSKLSVAYFSFSNKSIQRKFCELSSKGVKIRVILDNGSAGQIDDLVMNNPECKDTDGKLNVALSYLGGNTTVESGGIWQLHHNKFLMLETPNNKVRLNFSSGNLSTFGTSLHLDHWVMTKAPAASNLIRAHKCVMEGLEAAAAAKAEDDQSKAKALGQIYITEREKCFDSNDVIPRQSLADTNIQIGKALASEEIAPLFSPNNNRYIERSFMDALNLIPKGGYIYIAIQHFLHPGVSTALTNAAKRGVDIRIIMDDDALRGESEVPGVDVMIKKLIKVPGIQIRFAETNRQAGGNGALMHNKFAILNGKTTFSGAGHYTNAAMNVNWENFYFSKNKFVITEYSKYFSELWNESVDFNYTVSKGAEADSMPPELGNKFLKSLKTKMMK